MADTGASILRRRPLSPAQLPIWRAEVLRRGTPRWTQLTIVRMQGSIDPDQLARAVDTVVARHPALRTLIRRQGREVWQEFGASGVRLCCHDQPTAPEDQAAAVSTFVGAAGRRRFPLYDSPLFRADLLVLSAKASVLALSLHHIAADGIALAGLVPQIAAAYQGGDDGMATDNAYERWLDQQESRDFTPGIKAAQRFYQDSISDEGASHAALYDRPAERGIADPPDLPEVTCILSVETAGALRTLARVNRATPFIVLLAAFASVLERVADASDLLFGTFVSGRQGETGLIVGSCINTLLVRIQLAGCATAQERIAAAREAWRPVRQHQATPQVKLAGLPLPQFAVNYLDMNEASFDVPGVDAFVTHAQQGFPLNDLLLYALNEQNGRLRLRLIIGSGTRRISPARLTGLMVSLVDMLSSWTDCAAELDEPVTLLGNPT